MSENAISVGDAAKDLLGLLDRLERNGESAILVKEGKPVATLSPFYYCAKTGLELAELWARLSMLSKEEAESFADDVENSHSALPPLKNPWD